jgi:dihydroneopterin aldolase
MPVYTININSLTLYGNHGVYAKEKLLNVPFQIDLEATFDTANPITSLEQTVNYQTVFEIIKRHFATHHDLLEELGQNILGEIKHQFAYIKTVSITITKLQPPIAGMQGTVGVTISI